MNGIFGVFFAIKIPLFTSQPFSLAPLGKCNYVNNLYNFPIPTCRSRVGYIIVITFLASAFSFQQQIQFLKQNIFFDK